MKTIVKQISEKLSNIPLIIALVVEVCLLVFFLLPLGRKPQEYKFEPKDFICNQGILMDSFPYSDQPGVYEDNSLFTGNDSKIEIYTPELNLKDGSYDVYVYYSTDTDSNTVDLSFSLNQWMTSGKYRNQGIPSGENQILHIPSDCLSSLYFIKGLTITVAYNGNGYLYLSSIVIKENRNIWHRYITYILLISLLIDFLLIFWNKSILSEKMAAFSILGITFLSSIPLMGIHLGYVPGHDLIFHLSRIEALADGIRNRQFPVRISLAWNNGYGYASSVFYSDFFLLFPALLRILNVTLQNAYKLYVVFVNFLTACLSYYSFSNLFKKNRLAIFGTFLYVLLPYRLTCIYVRAAVGEYTAMSFLPLIAFGIYRILGDEVKSEIGSDKTDIYKKESHFIILIKDDLRIILPVVLGLSGIVESHVLTCFITAIVLALLCLIEIKRIFTTRIWIYLFETGILVLLINAWFVIPFLDYLRIGITAMGAEHYLQKSGTYVYQLFDLFSLGNGGNVFSGDEYGQGISEMCYSAGAGIVGIVGWFYLCLCTENKGKIEYKKFANICCCLGILTLCMTTVWFPWDFFSQFNKQISLLITNIQFPWRFLGVSGCLMLFVTLCLLAQSSFRVKKVEYWFFTGVVFIVAFISSFHLMHSFVNNCTWSDFDSITLDVMGGEYLPRDTSEELLEDTSLRYGDHIKIVDYERDGYTLELQVENDGNQGSYVDVPVLFYPGYKATDQSSGEQQVCVSGENGRTRVMVPANYKGTFYIRYTERKLWRVSEVVSVVTLVYLLYFYVSYMKQKKSERGLS